MAKKYRVRANYPSTVIVANINSCSAISTQNLLRDSLTCPDTHVVSCHKYKGCFCSKSYTNCKKHWKTDNDFTTPDFNKTCYCAKTSTTKSKECGTESLVPNRDITDAGTWKKQFGVNKIDSYDVNSVSFVSNSNYKRYNWTYTEDHAGQCRAFDPNGTILSFKKPTNWAGDDWTNKCASMCIGRPGVVGFSTSTNDCFCEMTPTLDPEKRWGKDVNCTMYDEILPGTCYSTDPDLDESAVR